MRRVVILNLLQIQTLNHLENHQHVSHPQEERKGHHLDGSHQDTDMTIEDSTQIKDKGFLHQGEMIKDITVLHDIGDLHQGG